MKYQLVKEQYKATKLEKVINDVCVEFPQCYIPTNTTLPQKVRILVSKAKDVEETIDKMVAEHKACIMKLEAKTPGMPSIVK